MIRIAVADNEITEMALFAKLDEALAEAKPDWWCRREEDWKHKTALVTVSGSKLRVRQIALAGIPYAYRLDVLDGKHWRPVAHRTRSGDYTVIFTLPQIAHQLLDPAA